MTPVTTNTTNTQPMNVEMATKIILQSPCFKIGIQILKNSIDPKEGVTFLYDDREKKFSLKYSRFLTDYPASIDKVLDALFMVIDNKKISSTWLNDYLEKKFPAEKKDLQKNVISCLQKITQQMKTLQKDRKQEWGWTITKIADKFSFDGRESLSDLIHKVEMRIIQLKNTDDDSWDLTDRDLANVQSN